MVSERKRKTVKEVKSQIKEYPVIGIIDMHALPARQLHDIRNKMRGNAKIMMVKKRLISIILKESGVKGAEDLSSVMTGQPALLMSKENPFRLARIIAESKSPALAKGGDIAPIDIEVKAGPTSLPAGPVIGELQKVKIPAMIEGDKISIRQNTVLVKEGGKISLQQADVMAKLGIEPMEIGLNLIAALDDGTLYGKDILFIPQEEYINDLKNAAQRAFNLTCSIGYYTPQNINIFLSRAHSEAFNLAMGAGHVNPETIKSLLAKGHSQAEALRSAANIPAEDVLDEGREEKSRVEENPIEETKDESKEQTENNSEENKPEGEPEKEASVPDEVSAENKLEGTENNEKQSNSKSEIPSEEPKEKKKDDANQEVE